MQKGVGFSGEHCSAGFSRQLGLAFYSVEWTEEATSPSVLSEEPTKVCFNSWHRHIADTFEGIVAPCFHSQIYQ
jgi:hypothetical protein